MDIHFDCTQCGRCCHNLKLPLSVDEAKRWAKNGHEVQLLIEATPAYEVPERGSPERYRFDRSFPAMSGSVPIRVSVIVVAAFEGACPHLLQDMRCGAYETRPTVCRIYPAEVSPRAQLVPAQKACPPEAWLPDQPLLLSDGVIADNELSLLIDAHRAASLADVELKQQACRSLGIASAAFANEGYALFSLLPDIVDEVFANRLLAPLEDAEAAQWQFVTNRQPTLIMLETVEATSQVISRGDTYIGFFEDDI